MARPVRTDLDFGSIATCTNLKNPVNANDAATKQYVDNLVEGLDWKESCRVATTANINLSSAPTSIDGVTLASGDRVLVKDQTTASQNGIYIFNGAGSAMTRALDANTATELNGAVVQIIAGTANAKTSWRQTAVITTLGTDNVIWESFATAVPDATTTTAGKIRIATQAEVDAGTVTDATVTPQTLANWSGRLRKYSTTIGDGTNTQYTITHNLNTRDIVVSIYANSGAYEEVLCDIEHTSTTTCVLRFATAPSANAYRVVVVG